MAKTPEFLNQDQIRAYQAGWATCHRGTDYDVGEDRWTRRNGSQYVEDWDDGYEDRAAGRERWHDSYCRRSGKMNECDEH